MPYFGLCSGFFQKCSNEINGTLITPQPAGIGTFVHEFMNPKNRWVKMADVIPWEIFEKKYSRLFKGTLMLDATCAPSNIRYPQNFSLLNEAREKLETIIIRFCKSYGFSRPRMYRKQARKNYLALAKAKKRSTKKIRATIRKQRARIWS